MPRTYSRWYDSGDLVRQQKYLGGGRRALGRAPTARALGFRGDEPISLPTATGTVCHVDFGRDPTNRHPNSRRQAFRRAALHKTQERPRCAAALRHRKHHTHVTEDERARSVSPGVAVAPLHGAQQGPALLQVHGLLAVESRREDLVPPRRPQQVRGHLLEAALQLRSPNTSPRTRGSTSLPSRRLNRQRSSERPAKGTKSGMASPSITP